MFFDTWLVCPLAVTELESALTVFTVVAGPPVRLMTRSADPFAPDSFGFVTVATADDDSYHTVKTTSPPSSHDPILLE